MRIGELSERSGLSIYTIRYYEKIGLLPKTDRSLSGRRDYDHSILKWIEFVARLKASGMPIKGIIRYSALWQQGGGTAPERISLLVAQGERVRLRIAELNACLDVIEEKIENLVDSEKV